MAEGYTHGGRSSIDASDALFLHPSDNPGMVLVSKAFDGFGFGSWKRAMEIALTAKNKLGFVNGSCKKPESNPTSLQNWERCNNMVISWILNALSKEISESVVYATTVSEISLELEERFGQLNGPKRFQIQKELSQICQGLTSITSYFTKIKRLWDEIQTLSKLPQCSCGVLQELHKLEENQKLM